MICSEVISCIPFSSFLQPSEAGTANSCLSLLQMKKLWYLSNFNARLKQLELLLKGRFCYSRSRLEHETAFLTSFQVILILLCVVSSYRTWMIPTGVFRKNQNLARHSEEINGYHIFAKLVKKIFSVDLHNRT